MVHHPWIIASGILGNIISIVMYLSPLPTFFRVCRKKSTEGFQSIPYVVSLFSAMLWIYYATLKSNIDFLVITINSFGCLVETIYIVLFLVYAPKKTKIRTFKLLVATIFVGFFLVLVLTHFFVKGSLGKHIVGWLCVVLATAVFAAPLSIMRLVIRTKSVEFMPITLSISITLNAIMWCLYGALLKDVYITLPNILGVIFGIIQMILYGIYKNPKVMQKLPQQNDHQTSGSNIKLSPPMNMEVHRHEVSPILPICDDNNVVNEDKNPPDDDNHNDKQSTQECIEATASKLQSGEAK